MYQIASPAKYIFRLNYHILYRMGENPINILTNHEYYKVEKIIEQIKPFWTKYDSLSEKDMMLLESNFTHRFPEDMREFFL